MSDWYKLNDQNEPVKIASAVVACDERKKQQQQARHVVGLTRFPWGRVSTVFLFLDHSLDEDLPVLFETLIFGGRHDGDMERYHTWGEAERGHLQTVKKMLDETASCS